MFYSGNITAEQGECSFWLDVSTWWFQVKYFGKETLTGTQHLEIRQ